MQIVKNRFKFMMISLLLLVIGFGIMFSNSSKGLGLFNYDIQFTGGTSIEVNINNQFENDDIYDLLNNNLDLDSIQLQKIGDGTSIVIKTRSLSQEERILATDLLKEKYSISDNDFSILDISATISEEMKSTSVTAVLISCIAMLIYITIRFKDIAVGGSAILALLHDALIILAFYGVFRVPLNEVFIAAILTVIGYSINATIVIFDRIRENKSKHKGSKTNQEIIDMSVNQSLRRSIFTSLTTFFTVISLYIFGVESVKIFALPIAMGIVCGTYSSICLAGSILYIAEGIIKKQK